MGVLQRKSVSAEGCSTSVATTVTLDGLGSFNNKDTKFNLIIIPEGVGTGTLALAWAPGDFPATFITAYNDLGVAVTIDLSVASTVIEISGVDMYKLRMTPSGVGGGLTGYKYSLVTVDT